MTLTLFHEFTISKEIQDLIDKSGLNPSDWYVGITKDENQRNANGRGVDINDTQNYICRNAKTRTSSCRIERYFIVDIGTDGGTPCNGGNDDTIYIYAINQTVYPITEQLLFEINNNI